MHVRLHIFSPGHGVERKWIMCTDLRQAGTRVKTGEGRIISSRLKATDPQHVKAVLNCLESGAAFSAMSRNGVEARLVGACEAFRPTDRTRLKEMRAVKNLVCDTPKASSASAERIERASQKVEKRSRTWRPGRAKQNDASRRHNGQVSEFTKMNHSMEPQKDGEWSMRLWRECESSQVPTHLEIPRESTLG